MSSTGSEAERRPGCFQVAGSALLLSAEDLLGLGEAGSGREQAKLFFMLSGLLFPG